MNPSTTAAPARLPARVIGLVLLIGAVIGVLTPPRYVGDASTYLGMATSLVRDRDVRWTRDDLENLRALRAEGVPAGLLLLKRADGYVYAKPPLYPLVAAPFVALCGGRGFTLLNGLLLAVLILLGADLLTDRLAWPTALGAAAVTFGASVTPVYLQWVDPFLFLCVLTAVAVLAWRRGWPLLAGLALGAMASLRPPYAILLLAPMLLALVARRWRDLGVLFAATLVVAVVILGFTRVTTGQWSPYTGERYYYPTVAPYETAATDEVGVRFTREDLVTAWQPAPVTHMLRGAVDLVIGRFGGLLLYFPALFACVLWTRRFDREKVAWLLALLAYCVIMLILMPHRRLGGGHALGNRQFVLLPLALVMVDFAAWRWGRLLATLALLALAVPVVEAPALYTLYPGWQTLQPPYRWFPVEWVSALELPYPFRYPKMSALTGEQSWEEAGGVWTKGGARAEFVLIRPADAPPTVELWSLLPSAIIGDGGEMRERSFQPSVHQTLTLAKPVLTIRDEYRGYAEMAVYRLTVETAGGVRPSDSGSSPDRRWLGVFVKPLS